MDTALGVGCAHIERLEPRQLLFLGKSAVYSAGVTLMAAFPRESRYLPPDAMLLIRCRQITKPVELQGPIRSNRPMIRALLHEFDCGIILEEKSFERLIAGSDVSMDELLEKPLHNGYDGK